MSQGSTNRGRCYSFRQETQKIIRPLSRSKIKIKCRQNPTTSILLNIGNLTVDKVAQYKVLGVTVSQSLKWSEHVTNICSKLNKRLYFFKQLKRAGMSTGDLLCFYKSVIRPVAEYVCPAWHSSLTVEQSNRIESFQKRALKIIYNDFTSGDNAYALNCIIAGLPQLADRREQLTKRQLVEMADTDNCLNYLLPVKRDSEIISSLRTAK